VARSLGFLATRVGRRYLAVHLLSALLPLAAGGVLTYHFVRAQVRADAEGRVSRLSKQLTLSTLASLSLAVQDLNAGRAPASGNATPTLRRRGLRQGLSDGVPTSLAPPSHARPLTADERLQLESGRSLLLVIPGEEDATILLASLAADAPNEPPVVEWRRASGTLLWGGADENIAADEASYCLVQAHSRVRVHCAAGMTPALVRLAVASAGTGMETRRAFEVDGYFVSSRDVYLQHEFGTAAWRAVVVQPAAVAYAPLADFGRVMGLGFLAVAILIFVMSHAQLRRTTEPLWELQRATARVQEGDFSKPVRVDSDDEYGDVARSFNAMAGTLGRQLQLLGNLDAIDRSALGTRDTRQVAIEALDRFRSMLRATHLLVAVCSPDDDAELEVTETSPLALAANHVTVLSADERAELLAHPRLLLVPDGHAARGYLPATRASMPPGAVAVFPLHDEGRLVGLVALRSSDAIDPSSADVQEARRLADRVALALSHVRVVRRLDQLSAGTLVAFARAIDANSPWTAGHSERVTRMAIAIGRRLQLPDAQLQVLERGGLLHDIGKIAVPASILDKSGPLTADEWHFMRRHPEVGCEILAPIPVFRDAIPIVRSHHERVDGSGYPDGLRGETIPLLARVLAVADVFDALISDRPYRTGLSMVDVIALIRSESGAHFDPRVVAAFLDAIRRGEIHVDHEDDASTRLAADVAKARQQLQVCA
jgi:putative nucleotidyltransferase with HDIG domain